jgi:ribonuclease HII
VTRRVVDHAPTDSGAHFKEQERAELRLADGRLALGVGALAHELIEHGDAISATIAAASIVAKVARHRLMARLGERYSGYGFERHKGYRTVEHWAAVVKLGPTPEHRLSVKPAALPSSPRGERSRPSEFHRVWLSGCIPRRRIRAPPLLGMCIGSSRAPAHCSTSND